MVRRWNSKGLVQIRQPELLQIWFVDKCREPELQIYWFVQIFFLNNFPMTFLNYWWNTGLRKLCKSIIKVRGAIHECLNLSNICYLILLTCSLEDLTVCFVNKYSTSWKAMFRQRWTLCIFGHFSFLTELANIEKQWCLKIYFKHNKIKRGICKILKSIWWWSK